MKINVYMYIRPGLELRSDISLVKGHIAVDGHFYVTNGWGRLVIYIYGGIGVDKHFHVTNGWGQ
jgi:hypothetical protein